MEQYIVVIPIKEEPYIANYQDRIDLNLSGSENNFYSIFKCKGYFGSYKFTAYMLSDKYEDYKNYNYKNNRTCEVEIFRIDDVRDVYSGYNKNIAEHIIKNINLQWS